MTYREIKNIIPNLKLNKDEVEILLEQKTDIENIKFMNENINIFYKHKKYTDLFDETGDINKVIYEMKSDLDKIEKESQSMRSFGSLNFITLPDEVRELNVKMYFGGLFRGKTYTTYYDFYKDLKKLDLTKICECSELQITKNYAVYKTYKLNVLDLAKIAYNEINNYSCMNVIENVSNADILESEIIKLNEKIIIENKRVINELYNYVSKEVYNYLKPHLSILQAFYDQALFHLSPITSRSSSSVFFVSNRHIANYCNLSKTKINYIINMFAVLGLIIKVSEKDIPIKIKKNAKMYADELKQKLNKKSNVNLINFYSWVDLTDLDTIKEIEDNTRKLIDSKISAWQITETECRKLFGKEHSDMVYKNNSASTRKSVRNRIKNNIYRMYNKY